MVDKSLYDGMVKRNLFDEDSSIDKTMEQAKLNFIEFTILDLYPFIKIK